jgi:hypothetical protein
MDVSLSEAVSRQVSAVSKSKVFGSIGGYF